MKSLLAFVALAALLSWFARQLLFGNQAARSSVCCGRFHQIARALLLYNADNGSLPPAYLVDQQGQPLHSWRALLYDYHYSQWGSAYNFREPWNGPNNSLLADQASRYFQCAVRHQWDAGALTNCVAITGPGTAFPGANAIKLDEITDGPENTIVAVHVDGWAYHWTEPRDLTLAEIDAAIASGGPMPWKGCHPEGDIYVILANGRVQIMSNTISPKTFRALVTIAGGDGVTQKELVEQGYFHYEYRGGEN